MNSAHKRRVERPGQQRIFANLRLDGVGGQDRVTEPPSHERLDCNKGVDLDDGLESQASRESLLVKKVPQAMANARQDQRLIRQNRELRQPVVRRVSGPKPVCRPEQDEALGQKTNQRKPLSSTRPYKSPRSTRPTRSQSST